LSSPGADPLNDERYFRTIDASFTLAHDNQLSTKFSGIIDIIDPARFMFDFAVAKLSQMNRFAKLAIKLKPCRINSEHSAMAMGSRAIFKIKFQRDVGRRKW
jgi:hypothetical protein